MNEILERLQPLHLPPLPEKPLVSVLIANYNYAQYIGEAIESILKQTYTNFEIIVCDDGSTDNSCEIVERYVREDPRVKLLRKPNGGVSSTLNTAYSESRGDIVALLDSDDFWDPCKLEKLVFVARQYPDHGMYVHRMFPVSSNGKILGSPLPRKMDVGWVAPRILRSGGLSHLPPASGISLRREIVKIIFPIHEGLKRGADGYIMRAAQFLTPIAALDGVLGSYRLHSNNITGYSKPDLNRVKKNLEDYETITSLVRGILVKRYSEEVATQLQIEDSEAFWHNMLALYVFADKPREGINGYNATQMLQRLPSSFKKLIWNIIVRLPSMAGKWLICQWWMYSPVKRFIHRVILR